MSEAAAAKAGTPYHISSAVVATMPQSTEAILATLAGMENVEIHGHGGGKIVVVIEKGDQGELFEVAKRITEKSLFEADTDDTEEEREESEKELAGAGA